jgi:hypothetical protein
VLQISAAGRQGALDANPPGATAERRLPMHDENANWRAKILGALRELKEDYRRDGGVRGESTQSDNERSGGSSGRTSRAAAST